VSDELLKNWVNESAENARLFAEEGLIIEVAEAVYQAMEAKDMSKAELAGALGKSKAYVSQLLSGSRNMTLRTLADIAAALRMRVTVALREPLPYGHWETGSAFALVQAPRCLLPEPVDMDMDEGADWSDLPLRKKAA
jgi:transcriptional regulator with XRE-family HTH domain